MPYNSETGEYERRATTILDATPDGDTVNEAVDQKLDQATDDGVTDLNHHRVQGGHYPSTSVDTSSRYLKQSAAGSVSWAEGAPIENAALSDLSNVSSATVEAKVSASSILTKIKTVDGSGSGLDADLFRGNAPSAFAGTSHTHSYTDLTDKPTLGTAAPLNFGTGDDDLPKKSQVDTLISTAIAAIPNPPSFEAETWMFTTAGRYNPDGSFDSGVFTFSADSGVTIADVTVIGGGGPGGNAGQGTSGCMVRALVPITTDVTVAVGVKGVAGASGSASSFGPYLTAPGGAQQNPAHSPLMADAFPSFAGVLGRPLTVFRGMNQAAQISAYVPGYGGPGTAAAGTGNPDAVGYGAGGIGASGLWGYGTDGVVIVRRAK